MAQYVDVPKELEEIKQKFAFGLTKRQIVSFGIALAVGGIAFWLTYEKLGITGAAYCLFIVAAPIALFGIYNNNGLYLEDKLKLMINFYKSEKIKTYQSENIFDSIDKAIEYKKLKRIVKSYERRKK